MKLAERLAKMAEWVEPEYDVADAETLAQASRALAAMEEALERCADIVDRYNHRQNEKVDDIKVIVAAALKLARETNDAR